MALEEVLRDPTDDVALRAYQGCGDFLLFWANEQGLVSDSVDPEVARAPVLVLLYHFRWRGSPRPKRRWRPRCPPRIMRRCCAGASSTRVDLATRLRYIDAYGRMFGFTHYPEAFAQGMAHWMAEDAEAARAFFREAWSSAPENPHVAAAYRASGAADQSN